MKDELMPSQQAILFVSHDAYRAGSQLFLLSFLRWLNRNSNLRLLLLLRAGGELVESFREIAVTYLVSDAAIVSRGLWASLTAGRGEQEYSSTRDALANIQRQWRPDLVYCNTVTNGAVMIELLELRCPIITHAHEMQYSIDHYTKPDELAAVIRYSTKIVAVSTAVRDNLINGHGADATKIEVHPPFVIVENDPVLGLQSDTREGLWKMADIPANSLVIGGCGTATWHKGTDLFVAAASMACALAPDLKLFFIWVGGCHSPEQEQYEYDVLHAGLSDKVRFLGQRADGPDWVRSFDIFALTSRVDSFPLVNLEAAAGAVPVVCFDGAGGARDVVSQGSGIIVPYLDVAAFANSIVKLARDPELRVTLGRRGRQLVISEYDINVVAPRLARVIESTLA